MLKRRIRALAVVGVTIVAATYEQCVANEQVLLNNLAKSRTTG